MTADLGAYQTDPVRFIDDFIPLNEKGQPWRLSDHQRRVIAKALRWEDGRLVIRTFLWGEMKKSGKTMVEGALGLWWGFVTPKTEIKVCANDLEQSVGRVFKTMVQLCKENPALAQSVTIRATEILISNGTVISAISNDYRGEAGSRHSLAIVDEPWGIHYENAVRLIEELTPPPTEPSAWMLFGSYAGFSGESVLLETMYKRGLAAPRIDDELELYADGEFVMFWSHTPRQPWQTPEYYAEQRRSLRPSTFARIHLNQWVTAESAFLTPELWDPLVDPMLRPLLPSYDHNLFGGLDIGTKDDLSAAVWVRWDGDRLALAKHEFWRPSSAEPIDLEHTVEAHVRQMCARYNVRRVLVDPYQAHRSITTLRAAGLPVDEYPQTVANTTAMGSALFDLVRGKNLRLYPSDELRQQALNTIAVESMRGWRIAKEKSSRKIDGIIALSMAIIAALDNGPRAVGDFGISIGPPRPKEVRP